MKTVISLAVAAMAASAVAPAYAESDKFQRVEFFGSWTQIDGGTGAVDFEGIGGGLRVVGGRRVGAFGDLQLEFVPTDAEGGGNRVDLDYGNYRAGAGWGLPAFGSVGFFQLKAEYVSLRTELEGAGGSVKNKQDGYGVHLQFEQDLAHSFGIHASLGYLDVDDADGTEYVIGLHWVPDTYGFFTQFRWMDLNVDDGGGEFEAATVRAGFRIPF